MTRHPDCQAFEPIDDALLHRFVDGDLAAEERLRVEAQLAADAEAFARAMDYQRQNVLLQALHGGREDDVMLPPAALGLARRVRQVRQVQRAAVCSVAACVLVGTGALGWYAQGGLGGGEPPSRVVAVFPQSTASTMPGDLAATPAVVTPVVETFRADGAVSAGSGQAAGRVGVHPPNLQIVGYQLVDGRADLTAYGPVIRFSYEPVDSSKGGRLALTVASFGADRQSLATSINPQHTSLFWQDGQFLFALSGTVEPNRLARVAEVVNAERAKQAEPAGDAAPAVAPAVETKPADDATPAAPQAKDDQPKET